MSKNYNCWLTNNLLLQSSTEPVTIQKRYNVSHRQVRHLQIQTSIYTNRAQTGLYTMTKIWRPIVYIRQKAQCFSKTVYFHDKDNTAVQSERVYFST